ncbi:MAG: DNA mismatch repair protein MutS [Phycisphaerales bacterium]|nr:DNA mismatch repair protein MutS [Phycisphaerales bacterium]
MPSTSTTSKKKPAVGKKTGTKNPWDTPGMRQWTAIKKEHPDCVLFFRMGDFYELFGEDAENISRDLGLSLTTRGNAIPMAGVPHHQKAVYLQRAIDQGYRVAVVDQLEDPKEAKGVVKRGVVQVVTQGTLVDESLLREEQCVPLGSIATLDESHAGIAVVELSTGAFSLFNGTLEECTDELARIGTKEVLFNSPGFGEKPKRIETLIETLNASGTGRPGWQFRTAEAVEAIFDVFNVSTLDGFGIESSMPCVLAAGATIRYLIETQAIEETQHSDTQRTAFERPQATLAHLRAPVLIDRSHACIIDATSLRSLEIEQTIRDQSLVGSLSGIFLSSPVGTRCVLHTPMGKRQVRSWLSSPLIDRAKIEQRQQGVGLLVQDHALSESLGSLLGSMCDTARIAGRVALGRTTPRDIAALGRSTGLIATLIETIAGSPALASQHDELEALVDRIEPVAQGIMCSCVDEPPAHLRAGGLIRDGVDKALDEARNLERDAGTWLAEYQAQLIKEHDLPSMKVGYNRVFGYYIELPAAQAVRAPDIFTRKQTLKNAERYITPELKVFEEKVLSASDVAIERERILFDQLCNSARSILGELGVFSDVVATLDCLLGFAIKARERAWCKPEIVDEPTLDIIQGRHPVLDETLGHRFVPNDCMMGSADSSSSSQATLSLITGPNMAGKSTYIRQNALLVVLAQAGSFIPADAATIGITKRIFTRVGADDALHRGQSTFMVEMIETANILNNADASSLVILDEIGRGTSTLDGLSLAWAICEWLAEHKPRTLFATHYHEITELEDRLENQVKNLHVAVREWTTDDGQQEIAFLHSIRRGRADESYGVHVAQLAGVPKVITDRAREVLDSLSVQHSGRVDVQQVQSAQAQAGDQLGLFTEYIEHPVMAEIREIKLDSMSPMEAFDELRRLQGEASK